MTRAQVRYLLGTPMVPGGFDNDRWDYDYYLKLRQLHAPAPRADADRIFPQRPRRPRRQRRDRNAVAHRRGQRARPRAGAGPDSTRPPRLWPAVPRRVARGIERPAPDRLRCDRRRAAPCRRAHRTPQMPVAAAVPVDLAIDRRAAVAGGVPAAAPRRSWPSAGSSSAQQHRSAPDNPGPAGSVCARRQPSVCCARLTKACTIEVATPSINGSRSAALNGFENSKSQLQFDPAAIAADRA